jgi:transcriptional regulator with XRE-family HTH domain
MMELANAVGISYSYVAMIRAGHRMPRLDIALRIHAVTGVDLEGLVTNQFEAA